MKIKLLISVALLTSAVLIPSLIPSKDNGNNIYPEAMDSKFVFNKTKTIESNQTIKHTSISNDKNWANNSFSSSGIFDNTLTSSQVFSSQRPATTNNILGGISKNKEYEQGMISQIITSNPEEKTTNSGGMSLSSVLLLKNNSKNSGKDQNTMNSTLFAGNINKSLIKPFAAESEFNTYVDPGDQIDTPMADALPVSDSIPFLLGLALLFMVYKRKYI